MGGGGGGVAQDTAQDAVMSGGADGRRNTHREKEDDEERAKRQRTEKNTELEIEVSSVAKINDSRRILDLRRDCWEIENCKPSDAAMFCACELRPRASSRVAPSRLNWNQHRIYAEHTGRKGWYSCANSSATSQTNQ